MIKVRHKETGDVRMLGESAFPYFAGIYERLDQPPTDSGAAAAAGEQAGPAQQSAPGKGRATTNQKEE
jgi:hypothetical protein